MRSKQMPERARIPSPPIGSDTRETENGAKSVSPEPALIAVTETGAGTAALLGRVLERALGARVARLSVSPLLSPLPALERLAGQGYTHILALFHPSLPLPPEVERLRFTQVLLAQIDPQRDLRELLRRSDLAVLDMDDRASLPYRQSPPCPLFTYSERHPQAGLTAAQTRLFPTHLQFEAVIRGAVGRAVLPLSGGVSIYQALAVLAVGLNLGAPLPRLLEALARPADVAAHAPPHGADHEV